MKRLGLFALFLAGLIEVLANGSQIATFLGIDTFPRGGNPGPISGSGTGEGLAPFNRPAHLVLIVENDGNTDNLDTLILSLLERLIPDDQLSVIAFTDSGPWEIMEPTAGGNIRRKIESKLHNLVPVHAVPREVMNRAVSDARKRLELSQNVKFTSALMVLSAQTSRESIELWFARIRSHTSAVPLKFGTRAGEGNRT